MAKTKTVERRNMTQIVDGKVTREPKDDETNKRRYFWWKKFDLDTDEYDEQMASEIRSTVLFMQDHQSQRINQLVVSTRLYGNSSPYNILGAAFTRSSSAAPNPSGTRISFNLCSSVIDTLVSQVAKNKVVPTFITSGAKWGMQRKAENLTKFTEGLFYEQDAHDKITYQARDAGVWGDGHVYVYRTADDRVGIARVLPHEFVFDLIESLKGKLKQLHRVYIEDRSDLLAEFPDNEKEIDECGPASYHDIGGAGTAADLVVVSESWYLPSGKDKDNGCYVKQLFDTNKVLSKKRWAKDYFPFPDLQYCRRLVGVDGQGACERLQNLQGEINRLMILDQKSRWMGASFKILSHISDKIPSQHFNNEVGPILKWAGTIPPQYVAPSPIDPSNEEKINSLIQKGYQQEGVSQLSASNVKPLGVNSGQALRTYDQIAEDRQLFFGQRVETTALEITRQAIEVVKDIYKDKKSYVVQWPGTHFLESVDWADINLNMDEYWLKAFPTSELPEEPSAKLETVQEYAQAGFITPRAARRLLRMPDVEMADKLADAAEDLICKSIEDIIYDKEKVIPDPEWDLMLAQDYCIKYLNYAKLNGCPKENIDMLRDFKSMIDDLIMQANPPPTPPAGAQATPLANPAPTPTSPLIPNVNGVAA